MAEGAFWDGVKDFFGGKKADIAAEQIAATATLAGQQLAAEVAIEKAKQSPEAIAERNKLYIQGTIVLLVAGIIITFIILKFR